MLHDAPSDGIDPVFFLILRIGDEVHGLSAHRNLERVLLVEDILCSLDGKARRDGDDAAGA